MNYFWRSLRGLTLLALLTSFAVIYAQDEAEPVSVDMVGSAIATPLIEALNDAAATNITINTQNLGTSAGLAAFCEGQATLAAVTRTLSAEEVERCDANAVEFQELLLGHNILTFVTGIDSEIPLCLTLTDLNTIFVPSAAGQVTNWSQISESLSPDLEVELFIPRLNTLNYQALDNLINGDGLRADAVPGDMNSIFESLISSPNAIGVTDLQAARANEDQLLILNIDFEGAGVGCANPSAENVEDRLYAGTDSFFLYVNADQSETLEALINFITSEDSIAIIEGFGFTAPTDAAYEINRAIIAGESGRQFGREASSFEIPEAVSGTVRIGGSAIISDSLNNLGTSLSSSYPGLTAEFNFTGEIAGVRRFCNGELDMLVTTAEFNADQSAACEANEITTISIELGHEAVVLVANAGDEFAQCLTPDQISFVWAAQASDTITNWNQLGADYPDQEMTLFGVREGAKLTDLLLARPGEAIPPVRIDTEISGDFRYRAAATANVTGGLTYMSWAEYETVAAAGQQNIQLVSVFNGDTCVEPSETSISTGDYSLSLPVNIVISQPSFSSMATRSLAWFIFSDANYSILDSEALIGLSFGRLPAIREQLEVEFIRADEAALAALNAETTTPEQEESATEEAEESIEDTAEETPEATTEAE